MKHPKTSFLEATIHGMPIYLHNVIFLLDPLNTVPTNVVVPKETFINHGLHGGLETRPFFQVFGVLIFHLPCRTTVNERSLLKP